MDEKVKKRGSMDEVPFKVPGESVAAFQDSYAELQSVIAKYEDIVEYLEKIWQEKVTMKLTHFKKKVICCDVQTCTY